MRFPSGHYVFLDLETTGGKAGSDRITEVGLIEVLDGEVIDQYQTLINPETHISSFITSLTGINNQMVAASPRFEDIAEDLLVRLHGRVLVAHNARFDHSFLKNEFARLGYDYRTKVLCTVKLSRALMPQLGKHSLDNLIHVHGLHVEGRHRAMADADLMVQLVAKWAKRFDAAVVLQVINAQLKRPSLPPHLPSECIDRLPNTPGVYLFYDQRDALLYVGKSINVRDRVKSHFSGDHASDKELELSQQVVRIDYQEALSDFGAQLLEAQLIKTLRPLYNRQLRKTTKFWCIELYTDKSGYLNTRIKSEENLPVEKLDNVLGMFRSKKMAEETLRQVSEKENLCHRLTQLEKIKKGACFSHQLKKCKGACVNLEGPEDYNGRLLAALRPWRFAAWPYNGPICVLEKLKDEKVIHWVHHWCYLGRGDVAKSVDDKSQLRFDYDTYKILLRFLGGVGEKNKLGLTILENPAY